MPFNPEHLLNGIAFAHGINESEKSKAPKPKMPHEGLADDELKKLHQKLLEHHLSQMTHHAKAVHTLTGGK